MQISDVRNALADAARDGVTLPAGVRKLTCTGYVPDAVTEPHFFVAEYSCDYDQTMRGPGGVALTVLEFTTRVLVARSDDRASQRVLDAMLSGSGAASLKVAIEAARGAPGEMALGGLAHDLHVMRMQGYRWYEHEGVHFVGAELITKVIGEG